MGAYEILANAIIIQAVKDYRRALRKLKKNADDDEADTDRKQIERFFRSEWYTGLTDVDGEYMLRRLQEAKKR